MTPSKAFPGIPSISAMLNRAWWLLLLRGLAAILFGIAAFTWPGLSVLSLVLLYGAYAFVDGVGALAAAFRGGKDERWWFALAGLVSLAAAAAAVAWPGLTAITLVILIGGWSIVRGVLEIGAGFTVGRVIKGAWALALLGLLSIAFGAMLVLHPAAGALALVWLIGGWAIAYGVLLTGWAIRLRRLEP